jgi:hypothetical protein
MADPAPFAFNRLRRRLLKSEAARLAAQLARSCFDYTPDGQIVRVADRKAVLVLERAFATMLRKGGEPVAIEITREAAEAFPRRRPAPDETLGARSWLAVGVDREGRGTYSLRHLKIIGADRSKAKALAETAMLGELEREMARLGFPMGPAMGGVC